MAWQHAWLKSAIFEDVIGLLLSFEFLELDASDVEIDGSGRILLPAALREYAGLEKEAVLIGHLF